MKTAEKQSEKNVLSWEHWDKFQISALTQHYDCGKRSKPIETRLPSCVKVGDVLDLVQILIIPFQNSNLHLVPYDATLQ